MSKVKRKPKAGDHFVALLVGGDKNQGLLKRRIAFRGVYLKHHWDARTPGLDRKALPPDVDVVISLPDQNISRRTREDISFRARQECYSVVAPGISQVDDKLDAAGFHGRPISIEDIEAPPVVEVAPEAVAITEGAQEEVMAKKEPLLQSQQKALESAGRLLAQKRAEGGLTAASIGKAIGCSGSAISAIEKGRAVPSDAMCSALERYYHLPEGTIPRLSKRKNNKRLGQVAGGVVPAPPPPEPAITLSSIEKQLDELEKGVQLPPFASFLVKVAELQDLMKQLQVVKVELSQNSVQVQQT